MSYYEQQVIDREGQPHGSIAALGRERAGIEPAAGGQEDRWSEPSAPPGPRCGRRSRDSSASAPRSSPSASRTSPRPRRRRQHRPGGPALLDLGELERVRDQLAAGVQELRATRARACRARAPRARAAAADAARTGPLQVRAPARAGPRAGRVRGLGGAPAARPDRHARRLVAAQALVRLSVSQGVAVHARPRFTEVSIAASVRR